MEQIQATGESRQSGSQKKRKVWLWILIGVLAIGAIAAAVVWNVSPQSLLYSVTAEDDVRFEDKFPVLYEKDGEAFVLLEEQEIALGNISNDPRSFMNTYNAVAVNEGKTLFYLLDFKDGGAPLMRLELEPGAKPKRIAQDVSNAVVADDGACILYVANIHRGAGDLYLLKNGKEEHIAESVYPEDFWISTDGMQIKYITMDARKKAGNEYSFEFSLYVKNGNNQPQKLSNVTSSDFRYLFTRNYVMENGRQFCSISSPNNDPELFMCKDGDIDKIADNGEFLFELNGGYVYQAGDKLYYKRADGSEQVLSENCVAADLLSNERDETADDLILLYEYADGEDESGHMLYELENGENKIEIGKVEDQYVTVNHNGDWLVYRYEGLHLMQKCDGKWREHAKLCNFSSRYEFYEGSLYYRAQVSQDADIGDMYRFDLNTNENQLIKKDMFGYSLEQRSVYINDKEGLCRYDPAKNTTDLLLKDAKGFCFLYNELYAITDSNDAFKILPNGRAECMADNVVNFYPTKGGVYLVCKAGDAYDVFFVRIGQTDTVKVCNNADDVSSTFEFAFELHLPKEARKAMKELYEDALHCLDVRNGTTNAVTNMMHRDYSESVEIADTLSERYDMPFEAKRIFYDFSMGFWSLDYALNGFGDEDDLDDMEEHLTDAVEAYKEYMEIE